MKTDHLDLWQVHDVRTDEEIEEIFGKGGAIEAFVEAKERGLVRFIGVTGHYDQRWSGLFGHLQAVFKWEAAPPHAATFICGSVLQ
jgi:aryl-alcohol dehydrogenase-like predicted oxidoreductase